MIEQQLSTVEQIFSHLCDKGMLGEVTEWCEMRHDCVYVVTCPDCQTTFTLADDEFDRLLLMSKEAAFVCGIRD